jgi:hypothetical protein
VGCQGQAWIAAGHSVLRGVQEDRMLKLVALDADVHRRLSLYKAEYGKRSLSDAVEMLLDERAALLDPRRPVEAAASLDVSEPE